MVQLLNLKLKFAFDNRCYNGESCVLNGNIPCYDIFYDRESRKAFCSNMDHERSYTFRKLFQKNQNWKSEGFYWPKIFVICQEHATYKLIWN